MYAGQDSHQPAPGNQPRIVKLPVSMMTDIADMLVLCSDNLWYTLGAPQFHQCRTRRTSASSGSSQSSIPRTFYGVDHELNITTYNEPRSQLLICCIPVAEPGGSASPLFLADLDRSTLPREFQKEGGDWFAIFNPKAKRVLDVSLVHTLPHDRLVASFVHSPL